MLPQNHFLVAVAVTLVAIVVLLPGMAWTTALLWVLASGVVAAAIDLDVMVIVARAARKDPELEPWVDPRAVSKDLRAFLVMLHRKGILGRVRYTHLASAVVATVVVYLAYPPLLVPVAIGAWSHLATDVPYLGTVRRAAAASGED